MPIRFKLEKECTSDSMGVACYDVEIPIREWSLSPESVFQRWVQGTAIPSSKLISVVFPDVEALLEYRDIVSFRYALEFSASPFFNISSSLSDFSNLKLGSGGEANFTISYKNFNSLNDVAVSTLLKFVIYGKNAQGEERLLEKRTQEIKIQKVSENDLAHIVTSKSVYRLKYFISNNRLEGDAVVTVIPKNLKSSNLVIRRPYFSSLEYQEHISFSPFLADDFKKLIYVSNPLSLLTDGPIKVPCEVSCAVTNQDNLVGQLKTTFFIELEVLLVDGDFSITKNSFDFLLKHHENKQASGSIDVVKNDGVAITVEHSDWLTVTETSKGFDFETISAKNFSSKKNKGFIKLVTENTVRVISVNVTVEKTVSTTLKEFNFCLDADSVIVAKKNELATKVKMKILMNFFGYNKVHEQVVQHYEYVFFKDKVEIFPGEEVQDFFEELKNVNVLHVNSSGVPVSKELFFACDTIIEISEYDFKGVAYETYTLEKIKFLPGKKPKAFPYLTNGTVRRTYTDSLVSVSALKDDFVVNELGELAGNLINNTSLKNSLAVCNISFKRRLADVTFGDRDVISKETISLHPVPNAQDVINVIFQNENFCPDWFSFSGEFEEIPLLTHTISEDMLNGVDFKVETEEKKTLKLNTGWLFKEEIQVLWELMRSPICFVHKNGEWIKTIPVSKKPLPYNSQNAINSQIVEFKIIDDAR